MPGASYSHRQRAQDYLLGKVGDIETSPNDDVCLAERVGAAVPSGVETLLDLDVHRELDAVETDVTFGRRLDIHRPECFEPSVNRPQAQPHRGRPLENDAFETLDRHLVVDLHLLAAAGEERGDVYRVPPNQTRPF